MDELLCELKLLSVVGAVVSIVLLTALNAGEPQRPMAPFPSSLEQVAGSANGFEEWDEGWGLVNVDLEEAE